MQLPYTPADTPVNPHKLEIPSKSPWSARPGSSQRTTVIADADGCYIAVVVPCSPANARLMTAAPELEEACRYCLDMLSQQVPTADTKSLETMADRLAGMGGVRARRLLETALDKAKGVQS